MSESVNRLTHHTSRFLPPAVLLLATATRFYRLGAQSLWSDEGNSVALAHRSFAEIAARTAHDIHPPLYYWLLKGWILFWGTSEFAERALSAVLGGLPVAVVYRLGKRWFGRRVGAAAALLAAVSPFQVYYAQEARMYMLLALLGAMTVWLAWECWQGRGGRWLAGYALVAALGLYTHYAFPVLLLAVNLAALLFLWRKKKRLLAWFGLQVAPWLLFAPWLPIAIRQLTTWPQSLLTPANTGEKLLTIGQYLALGVSAAAVDDGWLWVFGIALAMSFGFRVSGFRFRVSGSPFTILFLWLLLPVGLTFFLFRPAYLKFLLVASPAFSLLLALGFRSQVSRFKFRVSGSTFQTPRRHITQYVLRFTLFTALLLLTIPSFLSLRATYFDPAFQRDNYRGIAATINAIGAANDTVLVVAPGQAEVLGYYYQPDAAHARVLPLPRQRPLDTAATIAALESIAGQSRRIFGVFWATEEADPDGVIERWLNEHTFKASDVWFGNVRLVQYATAAQARQSFPIDAQFGESIRLTGYQLPTGPVVPGDILQLGLQWRTSQSLTTTYTVFAQVLDGANHLVGQRDAPPLVPTTTWTVGSTVDDRHGLMIQPGTPPGEYRLIVGLYNSATGQRLSLPDGRDFLALAPVAVQKNPSPLPIEAFTIQHRVDAPPLVGYDLYKLGHASDPAAPLHPGDAVHLNFYWQKLNTLTEDDTVTVHLIDTRNKKYLLWQGQAAVGYPISLWGEDEIVRGQANAFLTAVQPGAYRLEISLGPMIQTLKHGLIIVPQS